MKEGGDGKECNSDLQDENVLSHNIFRTMTYISVDL